jgi:long-subunit fatty acid transport protein
LPNEEKAVRPTLWVAWSALIVLALVKIGEAQPCTQTGPFGITLPPSLHFATSPNPVGSGARAVGKGTAFIGVADDATAASHNPGGLVQLQRPEVSVVGSYFLRFESQDVTRPDTGVADQTLDSADLNYLSLVYPFELLQRNVTVSVNFQRLFDLQGATDVASNFTTIDGIQQVSARQKGGLFSISPAAAIQITPALSLGMALNIWPDILDNGWEQEVTVTGQGFVPVGNRLVPFTSAGHIKEKFTFEGFNVTTGFLWTISSVFSLGGVVRTPFTAQVTRAHTSALAVTLGNGSPTACAQLNFRETLDMDIPLSYGLGLSARLSDALTLSLDVSRIHWSDFRLTTSTRDNTLLVENGAPSGKGQAVLQGASDDATSVRLGAEYLWIRPPLIIPLRAGVFYDPEPGDGGLDDFFGFSVGTGITLKQFLFDMAYTFRAGTVHGQATNTAVSHHGFLASIIYRF